jgi:hypothetical protein
VKKSVRRAHRGPLSSLSGDESISIPVDCINQRPESKLEVFG